MEQSIERIITDAREHGGESPIAYIESKYALSASGIRNSIVVVSIPNGGAVVDVADGCKILAHLPAQAVADKAGLKYFQKFPDEYDVYRAVDGSVVTIYYCPRLKRWMLATSKMFDVSGIKWMGDRTWLQAMIDASHSGIVSGSITWPELPSPKAAGEDSGKSAAETTAWADCLSPNWFEEIQAGDKGAVYTVLFHHRDFHPLAGDPDGIWQISGPVISGMPKHAPEKLVVDESDLERAAEIYLKTGAINHGFVMRRKAGAREDAAAPAAIFAESSLHKMLRRHMYDIRNPSIGLTHESREFYSHVRAYLTVNMRENHLKMFPRAAKVFEMMRWSIGLIASATKGLIRRDSAGGRDCAPGGPYENKEIWGEYGKIADAVCGKRAVFAMNSCVSFAQQCAEVAKPKFASRGEFTDINIADIITEPSNAVIFMRIFGFTTRP